MSLPKRDGMCKGPEVRHVNESAGVQQRGDWTRERGGREVRMRPELGSSLALGGPVRPDKGSAFH